MNPQGTKKGKKELTPEQQDRRREFLRLLNLSGWSDAEVAELIHFDRTNPWKYRKGKEAPSELTLGALRRVLEQLKPEVYQQESDGNGARLAAAPGMKYPTAQEGSGAPEPINETLATVQKEIAQLAPEEVREVKEFVSYVKHRRKKKK